MEKEKGESMVLDESFELYNGVTIPKIGLGTWFIDDDKAAQAVKAAVEIGYRHLILLKHMEMKEVSGKAFAAVAFQEKSFL